MPRGIKLFNEKYLEEEELRDFLKKDIKKRQLCCIRVLSDGEVLFQHITHEANYESLVHLGLMHYLSLIYPDDINPPKD